MMPLQQVGRLLLVEPCGVVAVSWWWCLFLVDVVVAGVGFGERKLGVVSGNRSARLSTSVVVCDRGERDKRDGEKGSSKVFGRVFLGCLSNGPLFFLWIYMVSIKEKG